MTLAQMFCMKQKCRQLYPSFLGPQREPPEPRPHLPPGIGHTCPKLDRTTILESGMKCSATHINFQGEGEQFLQSPSLSLRRQLKFTAFNPSLTACSLPRKQEARFDCKQEERFDCQLPASPAKHEWSQQQQSDLTTAGAMHQAGPITRPQPSTACSFLAQLSCPGVCSRPRLAG